MPTFSRHNTARREGLILVFTFLLWRDPCHCRAVALERIITRVHARAEFVELELG
jgi:hypothetical protein